MCPFSGGRTTLSYHVCTNNSATSTPLQNPEGYTPTEQCKSVLSKSDLDFGRKQVKQMLRDRPLMQKFLSEGDTIYLWLVRQFAGSGTGVRIYWQNKSPSGDSPAENYYPIKGRKGTIRIARMNSENPTLDGERQCAAAVFELLNIRQGPSYYHLWKEAVSKKISIEEFVTGNTKLEFMAIALTRRFYHDTWLPAVIEKRIATEKHIWRADGPAIYEEWLGSKDGAQYIEYWKSCYPE